MFSDILCNIQLRDLKQSTQDTIKTHTVSSQQTILLPLHYPAFSVVLKRSADGSDVAFSTVPRNIPVQQREDRGEF
jgi:hypothetical protein